LRSQPYLEDFNFKGAGGFYSENIIRKSAFSSSLASFWNHKVQALKLIKIQIGFLSLPQILGVYIFP
jgi:hypothetical protein